MKTYTLRELAELVRMEFRSYGFRCDGDPVLINGIVYFDEEPVRERSLFGRKLERLSFTLNYYPEDLGLNGAMPLGAFRDASLSLNLMVKYPDGKSIHESVGFLVKVSSSEDVMLMRTQW